MFGSASGRVASSRGLSTSWLIARQVGSGAKDQRPCPPLVVAASLAALFAGPTSAESDRGLRSVRSGASGTSRVGVERATALVRLLAGCGSGGSTITVADLLAPTLRQFAGIRWVKVFAPDGTTENAAAPGDSRPECLEP